MLKHEEFAKADGVLCQPPSGGCVLTHEEFAKADGVLCQPPSGGCVLKQVFLEALIYGQARRLQAAVC
ncbi:hypothetical protein ACTHTD_11580, partial [Neisseria sp. P0017.S005]|uniref:hypothetical protein n=1 Tax=Neisseria sp. P0017.S005 TaxID=3436781 RepID=UPI003F822FC3